MLVGELKIIRFGPFVADFRSEEIRRNGRLIKLQSQPIRVLAALLEKPGELVTREELRHRIWPEDTFVDFDHSLNTAIKKLRQALGDDAGEPVYIETLPKRGYRFIGTAVTESSVEGERREVESADPYADPFRLKITVAIALVVAATIVVTAGQYFSSHSAGPMKIIPLVSMRGDVGLPAFSPDGNEVVFQFKQSGDQRESNLFVLSLTTERMTKLTDAPGDYRCPRWSPDGKYIAYLRVGENDAGIDLMLASGGAAQEPIKVNPWCGCFDWSPDGTNIIYSDSRSPEAASELHRVRLDTYEDSVIPTGGLSPVPPRYSPDGKWIALGSGMSPVAVLPATGGTPKLLTDPMVETFVYGYGWTPDSKEIVFSSERNGLKGLFRVPISGGKPKPILLAGEPTMPEVAKRGNRMLYLQRSDPEDTIFRLPLGKTAANTSATPTALISSNGVDEMGQISPDGKKIVFQSNRKDGFYNIWVANSDGSDPVQLTDHRGGQIGTPRWSPDGRWISYGAGGLYVVNANGGLPRKLPLCGGGGSWSNDGKWIYCTGPFKERTEIWAVSVDGKEQRQVTRNGGFDGFESADGKYLYFVKWNTAGIFRIPIAGGPEVQVLKKYPPPLAWAYWVLVEDGIYFVELESIVGAQPPYWISFYDFKTERSRHVAQIPHRLRFIDPGFSVAPDRTWMAYHGLLQGETERHLMLVENFR